VSVVGGRIGGIRWLEDTLDMCAETSQVQADGRSLKKRSALVTAVCLVRVQGNVKVLARAVKSSSAVEM
jgi:hypothetical protein